MGRGHAEPKLSVVVCTNRPSLAAVALARLADARQPGDEVMVVIDQSPDEAAATLAALADDLGMRVVQQPSNLGLSVARNTAIARVACRHLVFVDDDVVVGDDTLDAIRAGFRSGHEIVGVRICADTSGAPLPWYVSPGQLHYLAVHHEQAKTWGACMGIDAEFARRSAVRFRAELGRRGEGLQSGDDTSFIADLRAAGGRETILDNVVVGHLIPPERLRVHYLTRRAIWQGRSEVRRRSALTGLAKEWRRNLGGAVGVTQHLVGLWFVGAVTFGVLRESLGHRLGEAPHGTPPDLGAAPHPQVEPLPADAY
jgi:glycosyltransferase involved in cell wall biosynthesis